MHRLLMIFLLFVLVFPILAQPPANCTPEEARALSEGPAFEWMARLANLETNTASGEFPTTLRDTWVEWLILYTEWRAQIEPTLPECVEIIAVRHELTLAMADYMVMLGLAQSVSLRPSETETMLAYMRNMGNARRVSEERAKPIFDAWLAAMVEQ